MNIAPGPIPTEWIKDLTPIQKRIIAHWTVTSYAPDQTSIDSYHFIIDGDGKIHRGNRDIDEPAPHTYMFNSAIGISLACMGGWNGYDTPYPPTKVQWETLINAILQLCETYGIPVTKSSVLMHGEVTETLGVDQWGKWDIGWLPHLGIKPGNCVACGNELRRRVLGGDVDFTSQNPIVKLRLQGSGVVMQGFLQDSATMVPLRPFVHWANEAGYQVRVGVVIPSTKEYRVEHTTPNTSERRVTLEGKYVQIKDTGYVELRELTNWMGLDVEIEKWSKTDRILVIRKREDG